ncbi:MAG: hypothetical protein K2M12_08685 [Muribaculaceae bacterium]|nr:hypothetical protein [Muribaculaceae bacterium]
MRRFLSVLAVALVAVSAFSQGRERPSEADVMRFRNEMRTYKHDFLARELNLSQEQQREFFPVYDEMDDAVERVGRETRDLEKQVREKKQASDVEIEAAARALFEQKSAEGEIEKQYFDRLKQTLTPLQLLKLKEAERKFTRQLMRQHQHHKARQQ